MLLRLMVSALVGCIAAGQDAAGHSQAPLLGSCNTGSTCRKHGLLR
jgi:hypothetical protein